MQPTDRSGAQFSAGDKLVERAVERMFVRAPACGPAADAQVVRPRTEIADLSSPAEDWIAFWRHREKTGKFPDFHASDRLEDLVRQDPDKGWLAILAVLEQIPAEPTDALFQVLAAGPLEDLLAKHGPSVLDRVEAEARRNRRFRLLLNGVWRSTIQPDVWARLEKYRTQLW